VKAEVVAESSKKSSSYSERPQDVCDGSVQLMDGEDATASSETIDSTLLSAPVASETTAVKEADKEGCTSFQPTLHIGSNQSFNDNNMTELESNKLSTGSKEEVSEAVTGCARQHQKPSPARRTVATQTDAYDSDDESSDDETSSSDADSDSDSSSVCSSDGGSVHSSLSSPFAAERCLDDRNFVLQPGTDDGNASVPEEEMEKSSSNIEVPAFSEKSGDNPSSPLCDANFTGSMHNADTCAEQLPSSVTLQSPKRMSPETCGSELDSETAVSEAAVAVTDHAGQHQTFSPCLNSQLCDSADCSSTSNTAHLNRGSAVAFSASDRSPSEQMIVPDADRMSSFKMPDCSPDDVRLTADAYQSSCGAYSSPQSNYGGISSDCSPPSCVQLPHSASQNSLGGSVTGYSMPTPSPTNSSARSFNMASPSSYQQLASVSQLDQSASSCCQMEPSTYQPPTSLPTSVASCQRPLMEGYTPSVPSHHQTMTPPMERVNGPCPSAATVDYIQPRYHTGSPGMPQMMGWPPVYMQQQQQQHGAVKPMEFVSQIASHGHMMPQNVGPTSCRSSSTLRDADRQRRYGAKNCNKTVASRSLARATPHAVPNVAVQPGTNMITGYDGYGPGIADFTGDPRGNEMSPALDYRSLHHRAALGYRGGYVSDYRHAGVYQYPQQSAAGSYAASMQSNHVHCAAQSVCPSSIAYGYMNRTLMGHSSFDVNPMRH